MGWTNVGNMTELTLIPEANDPALSAIAFPVVADTIWLKFMSG